MMPRSARSDHALNRARNAGRRAMAGPAAGSVEGMTADAFATASGLVERTAAAFVSGVPEDPGRRRLLRPGSVTWRLGRDLRAVAGLRGLLMQALHPLAMAGVDEHSEWRQDPVGRLAATSAYVTIVTYGDRAAAERAAARVRRIHTYVRGTDPVTGSPTPPATRRCCCGCTRRWSTRAWPRPRCSGTPLSPPDADRYVAEMVAAAVLVGIPAALAPDTVAALDAYLTSVRPELQASPAAGSRWPTCSTRRAWTRTSRRSGRTSGTARRARAARLGAGDCTAFADAGRR